jgi:dihydroorotase
MQIYLIKNILIVNEGTISSGDVLIKKGRIDKIAANIQTQALTTEINGEGLHLLPGAIDDQVHFREPGLTHKANIHTESRAAVAGGVTSFMEMPNTIPPALTQELLEEKYEIASRSALANYSFFMGTSNNNADEVLRTNEKKKEVCGIKIFMGSSTGNLLVNNPLALDRVFRECEVLIATHCEEERVISQNLQRLRSENREFTAADHPLIRDDEACFQSSFKAVQLAKKHGSRLHILHLTTEKEMQLFTDMLPLPEKRITAEVCVHHLHFSSDDYARLGNLIKCNPAIKAPHNREALWKALISGKLDLIATDHAPHTLEEKTGPYEKAHAGLPLVQHSLPLMLHYVKEGRIGLETVAKKMSHAVAICFRIKERGFIREGYYADLALVDLNAPWTVAKENILYKCGWSPFEGFKFPSSVKKTFVNGNLVYGNGLFDESQHGQRLQFDR